MSVAPAAQARSSIGSAAGGRSLGSYLLMPLLLAGVLLALYLYVSNQELDSIEARTLTFPRILNAARDHVLLAAASTVITLLIAIPLGIMLTRPFARRIRAYVIGVLTVLQAVPTIAVLVLLAVVFLILGFWIAIIGLVLYAIVPVLLNTMVGIEQVDDNVLEAGRGMGMSKATVLRRIELPLSIPVMLAGIRTALVINVGTATLATYINAGGLGDIISAGLATNRFTIQLVGAVLTSVLALLIDYLAGVVEEVLRPRGL
ncbi:ABC transporter permease [Pseudactinotalea sp. Z1748]|uniref:ABC transporter permease n=1 Tax=Pseudactinotalea sp. Z1748 TaxID=3413027 RepID=UPI003C7B8C00